MLKEEIGHYKSLVNTKEKELSDLSTVFHTNMNEYKCEVRHIFTSRSRAYVV